MDEEKELPEHEPENHVEDENKSAISADLIRGHINTIILRTLYERDKYGYEIIEEIEKKSHGQYSLKQPTLYSALKRLESQGYINAYWKTDEVSLGGRRKYYTLTENGREITEKNQAEWEYSRTVIDNLISDRSFDFSQPAPTAVDFKILKKSTSRVPVVKDEDDDEDAEDKTEDKVEAKLPEIEIRPEAVTLSEQVISYEQPVVVIEKESAPVAAAVNIQDNTETLLNRPENTEDEKSKSNSLPSEKTDNEQPREEYVNSAANSMQGDYPEPTEEQRRIAHENYLKLISEPVVEEKKPDIVPVSDSIDTDKLIYNNKPETERDYRNLINNLFDKTVKRVAVQQEKQYVAPTVATTVKIDDVTLKADTDGLKVNTSDYVISSRKRSYNRGATLFKSSLIISVILLLEFALSLIFKSNLGVTLAYPFMIFAIAAAQFLIFAVLYYADTGKASRKPPSNIYLTASIIVTVIIILIIFVVAILLGVNFTSAGDIFAKLIIPCLIALNIPTFAVCFYLFSKQ